MATELSEVERVHVVDVGARGGLHARWSNLGQEVKAILFEPDREEYSKLIATFGDTHIVLNTALSDSCKETELYLCNFAPASSMLRPVHEVLERYYADMKMFEIVDTVKVTTDTLDHQLQKIGLVDIDFVKVDVQGHELPILHGGNKILKEVIGVEVEVEFLPVYEEQPLFSDVDACLRDSGFELFDIKRTYLNRRGKLAYGDRKGQLTWGDALYFKSPEQLLANETISASKIMRAFKVYLAYNYPDLADTLFHLASKMGILPAEKSTQMETLLTPYKVEQMNALPNFRGKRRIYRLLNRLTQLFSRRYRTDRREDAHLGNPPEIIPARFIP